MQLPGWDDACCRSDCHAERAKETFGPVPSEACNHLDDDAGAFDHLSGDDELMCVVDCDAMVPVESMAPPDSPDESWFQLSAGLSDAQAKISPGPRRHSLRSLDSRASAFSTVSEKNLSVEVQMSIDTEVVRSVPLASSLQFFGWLWRFRPEKQSQARLQELWERSEKAEVLDIFLSHTWWTPGHHKFTSLLLSSYWHLALVAWLLANALLVLAYHQDLLPRPFSWTNNYTTYTATISCGPWAILVSFCAAGAALFTAPHWPSRLCSSERCFFDVVCIHQTDQVQRERGIYNIGGCLAMSKELRILWSPPYFSRLWCVFEIAAYRRANPTGQMTFQPLFIERDFLLVWPCTCVSMLLYFLVAGSNSPRIGGFVSLALCFAAFIPGVHAIRRGYQEQEQMLNHLAAFDINEVGCSKEFDREFIFSSIARWYGSLEEFTSYVRGPLKDELGTVVSKNRVPISYCALALSSLAACQLDIFAALVKAGAPQEVLNQHLAAQVSFLILGFWSMLMLFWLSQRFALPRFSGRAMDWAQTAAIIILWSFLSIGPMAFSVRAQRSSLTAALISVAGASIILATSLLKSSYSWCNI